MPPADHPPLRRANAARAFTHSLSKGTLRMAIQIDQWNFDGPFTSTGSVLNRSGTYAILTRAPGVPSYSVVDAGESGD